MTGRFRTVRLALVFGTFSVVWLTVPGTVAAQQQGAPSAVTPHMAPETVPETSFDVPDAARTALAFTRYALDVKLEAASAAMHVRAIVTVKNTSAAPLPAIPLQISSTLVWETIEADGKKLSFAHHTVDTDADHTGAMNEAWITFGTPLAPGEARTLTVFYGGTLSPSAQRLERIGTPPDIAIHSDWDGIREDFTGLRGFGNVLWYPACAPPVALGEGDRLFAQIGEVKQRESTAIVTMTVTEEFAGDPPNAAFLDGVPVPVRVDADPKGDLPGVVSVSLPETPLGFTAPSLFVARRTLESGNNVRLYARQGNAAATQAYTTAASILAPQLTDWLGAQPKGQLSVLDLPEADDSPGEERALWLTNIATVDPKRLETPMSHVLAHAWFASTRPWLFEGVAQFMASLWTEHQSGRETAITQLDNLRGALSLAETADPDHDPGQPLISAKDPIFFRTKATFVFWMLRGIVGDKPLATALREYDASQDTSAAYLQHLLEQAANQPLDWFFRDWVDRDRGLPALSVEGVTPSLGSGEDSYIVAVTVSNSGGAVADVPV
ncbi:MAG: hypothetical protein QOH85_618, partial [Acidobacteriaceae bacterium]|nr:hypothetical protein [Acidobacteriaceae bacterium]